MTSLCPGPLFRSPGLNNYSTPSSRTDTPSEIQGRFSRVPFNGIPWPKSSPVSKVYDVRNSSTKMILLNNKFSKKKGHIQGKNGSMRGCRLRGQTLKEGEVKGPDPERHNAETPYVNRRSHIDCTDSSSPVFKPTTRVNIKWANATQRPPIKFEDGSSVNYKRHTTCMVSDDLRTMNWRQPRRPYSTSIIRESMRSRSPLLEDLSPGERLYMYSIARVYSVDSMRKKKQSQYCHILHREVERGVYTPEECERYWRYLNSPRKTQQGPNDNFQRRRVQSAPHRRSKDRETDGSHQDTASGRQSETSRSFRSKSRASTRPVSRASVASSKNYKKKTNSDTQNEKKPEHSKKTTEQKNQTRTTIEKDDENDKQQPVKQVPVEDDQDDEGSQNETQVRGEDSVKDNEMSDEPTREVNHREGRDRPKSRLGGRKKSGYRNRDTSDDDYSSDSNSDSDQSSTDKTTSLSKSTTEPTTSSKLSKSTPQKRRKEKAGTEKTVEPKETKPENESRAAPPKGDKHDSSYSEDFTETSASQSVSHAKGDNSATKQSHSSESETVTESASFSQSKTTSSSDQTTSGSVAKSRDDKTKTTTEGHQVTDDSTSGPQLQSHASGSESKTTPTTQTSSSEDSSRSEKSNVKDRDQKVQGEDMKVKDDDKVTNDEVKVNDDSYSEDFTESKSADNEKPKGAAEKEEADEQKEELNKEKEVDNQKKGADLQKRVAVDVIPRNADDTNPGRSKNGNENERTSFQRRDSIELNSDDRVRDWDKIEY